VIRGHFKKARWSVRMNGGWKRNKDGGLQTRRKEISGEGQQRIIEQRITCYP